MSKPYEDCDLLEKLILENPNDAARIAALLAQRFARRHPPVKENPSEASVAYRHQAEGSPAKDQKASLPKEENVKDAERIGKEIVKTEDLSRKSKDISQTSAGITAAEMMHDVRNHNPEGLSYGRRKEDAVLKASATDETYQAHIWVDVRTFGADGSYFLPTFNLARSSLLIACYPNHPFQVNTLLEMVIERKQDHIDLNKLDGTNLMNYFRRGVTPEILEDKIYFVGKLVRIGEIRELEGYPKHKVALGVKIVQIDKKQLANWEHFLDTIKNSSQSANSYERGA